MKNRLSTFLFASLLSLSSCVTESTENSYVTEKSVEHIILVGFDGMSAEAINNGVEMPNLRRLMSEGAYTTKCRSILPSSSAANWASMFMGASSELHGYNDWGSMTPDLPSRVLNENSMFPTINYELRRSEPDARISVIHEWDRIKYLVDTTSLDYIVDTDEIGCINEATKEIEQNRPDLLTVVFDQPDGVGHSIGWESEEYMTKLTQLDGYLGEILKSLERAEIADKTLIIVASDHGGINTGHGGTTMNEMETPLVIWGEGVKQGFEIEDSVMIFDIASTILSAKHIDQPQVWIGRAIESAFIKE